MTEMPPWNDLTQASILHRWERGEQPSFVDLSHALRNWMEHQASCVFPQMYLKAYTENPPKVFVTFGVHGPKAEGGEMPYAETLAGAIEMFKENFQNYANAVMADHSDFPNCPHPVMYWRRYPLVEKDERGYRIRCRCVLSY